MMKIASIFIFVFYACGIAHAQNLYVSTMKAKAIKNDVKITLTFKTNVYEAYGADSWVCPYNGPPRTTFPLQKFYNFESSVSYGLYVLNEKDQVISIDSILPKRIADSLFCKDECSFPPINNDFKKGYSYSFFSHVNLNYLKYLVGYRLVFFYSDESNRYVFISKSIR